MLDNRRQADFKDTWKGSYTEPFHRERDDAFMNIGGAALVEGVQLKITLTRATKVTLNTGSACFAIPHNRFLFAAMRARNVYLCPKKNEEHTRHGSNEQSDVLNHDR